MSMPILAYSRGQN
uniref:Uncharacterized protein n=1 Tax=Arundo donax TaxID=35708 RepID=A0A0A9G043_ARUDO